MNLDVYCIAECLATCVAQNSSRLLRVAKSLLGNWPSGCTEKNTSRCASRESTMSKLAMICYDAFTKGYLDRRSISTGTPCKLHQVTLWLGEATYLQ